MTDWLLNNLDQVFGLVIGFTTVAVYWLAGTGRTSAWIVGLCGNALWWAYAFTVGTWTLLLPIAAMTYVHIRNLRMALRKRTPQDGSST